MAIVVGGLGYVLNLLPVPLLPDLQLLFGAVPAFALAVAYGAGPGALAGGIAGLRTVFLWGHPYGWVLLALEAGAVGLLRDRLRPVFAVGAFWLAGGFALGLVSYGLILGVPWFEATIAILKQVLNGLVNGLLAEALILVAPVRRALRLRNRPPLRRYLGVLAALPAALPLLAFWIVGTRQQADAAVGAAELESRVATLLFASSINHARTTPTLAEDTAAIAALHLPGLTLRALAPDGRVLRALPGGQLLPDASAAAGAGARRAQRLVAQGVSRVGGYSFPGRPAIPFLRVYEQILMVAVPVGRTGWVAWSELPFQLILAPLGERVFLGEVVMIAALLLALLLATLVARRLERPIAALMEATGRLAAGDLDARVRREPLRRGPEEAVVLARRLDAMAERIRGVEQERARLLEAERTARAEAERHAREEAALREAMQAVTRTFTVEEVIGQIAASALQATGADGAYVERIEAERRVLRVAAAAGDLHLSLGAELPLHGSYAEQVLRTGEPALVPRLADAERCLAGGMSERWPNCAAVILPLLDSGSTIGALILLRRERGFEPDEVKRARMFASLAGLAFRKVHLLEESELRRDELERVMESRTRLIRGFSHDVKNPLGAADGYLQLLEEQILGEISPRQMESIGRVRRAVHAALSLIEDLVELARAEAGQLQVQPHAVNAGEVVREMAGEYRAQAEAAALTLVHEIAPGLPLIRSDDRRVRQVLGNLLSNAVKYTPAGGRLGVRVEPRRRDCAQATDADLETETGAEASAGDAAAATADWVAIDVWDTGQGIPEDRRDRIFQEFTRLEPARTPGAGLGLAISRRVARAIGGDLTFVSRLGSGSTFTLWLPREWKVEREDGEVS